MTVGSQPVRNLDRVKIGNDFELDVRAYELRRAGKPLKLEPIPMELLVLLIEHRGELVTREQIIERIWGKGVFLDTDNSINAAVRKLRQALKDDPGSNDFIVTVTGKGYRFVAPVEDISPPLHERVAPEDLLGKKVSHYRVLELLGGGGMGVVYKAEDLKLGRPVALKFLPSELTSDPVAFERLQREARAASSLDHPNICSIYQLDEHEGQPFIVMQLLEGQTLREWIESALKMTTEKRIKDSIDIAIQIADGLEAAHQKGIIHRDIKPTNIFITGRGQAKILDFGVAKYVDVVERGETKEVRVRAGDEGGNPISGDANLTRTGASVGTPSYLSPEQIRHEDLDARTDLFSFGLVLYEMVTGQRAFSGSTVSMIREAVINREAPPARELDASIPQEVDQILARAIEKDRNVRYQNVAEIRADLVRLKMKRRAFADEAAETIPDVIFNQMAAAQGRPNAAACGDQSAERRASELESARKNAAMMPAGRKRMWIAVGTAILAVLVTPYLVLKSRTQDSQHASATRAIKSRRSVAVLRFRNLSNQQSEEWISTALAEMLSSELGTGQQLRVIPGEDVARMELDLSLSSVRGYGPDTLKDIRKNLGTDIVVQGSYLVSAQGLRIDLTMQEAGPGETIGTVSENGSKEQIGELVSRAGASLREQLGVAAIPAGDLDKAGAALPADPQAARLYSDGLAKLRAFDALAARDLLERAIAVDPNHALSHSWLAESLSALGYDAKAQTEAKKALDLSAGLPRESQLLIEGRARELSNNYPEAIEVYRALWQFFPDDLDSGLRLSAAQTKASLAKEAMLSIVQLRALPEPNRSDPRIDLAEANASDSLGDFQRMLQAASQAGEKARQRRSRLLLAQAKEKEGWAWERLGSLDKAIDAYSESRDLAQSGSNPRAQASALNGIANALYDKGDLESARKFYEQALTVARQVGAQQNISAALLNIGNVLYDQGKLAEARQYYQESLESDHRVGDKRGMASGLGSLANVLEGLGDLPGAARMQEDALQAFREVADRRGEASTLNNLGDVLAIQGKLALAKQQYEEAMVVQQQIGYRRGRGFSLFGLSEILLQEDRLQEARVETVEAIDLRQELKDENGAAQSQMQLARIALEQGNLSEAEELARKAADEFDRQKENVSKCFSTLILSRALLSEGKIKDAQTSVNLVLNLCQDGQDQGARLAAEIVEAEVQFKVGATPQALSILENARAEATRTGHKAYSLESILLTGKIELVSGRTASGRLRLQALQKDAQNMGYLLIERKAVSALESSKPSKHAATRRFDLPFLARCERMISRNLGLFELSLR
jgi:serine/threonine protein kinase/tetratricopeptide (TPR) repeat protein/TolB-like protein